MTDLYDEWWTQRAAISEACRRGGHVLITGLGLALVVDSMLRTSSSRVERVTVVEASEDVISLVAPSVRETWAERIEIVHASAFDWNPPTGSRYSVGWHDIWDNPQEDSVEGEMQELEKRYSPFCDWQGSWPRDYLAAVDESSRQLGGW